MAIKMRSWIWLALLLSAGIGLVGAAAWAQSEEERPKDRPAADRPQGERALQIQRLEARLEQLERELRELRGGGNRPDFRDRQRDLPAAPQEFSQLRGEPGPGPRPLPPEARERAEALKRQIQEARQAGRADEAERLLQELQALTRRFAGGPPPQFPPEVRDRLENLKQEIHKLREAGENERAAQLEREARDIMARYVPDSSEPMRRLHHLRVAVENLRAAGAHELAAQVAQQIENLERELGPQRRPPREGERDRIEDERPERRRPERERPQRERRERDGDAPAPQREE